MVVYCCIHVAVTGIIAISSDVVETSTPTSNLGEGKLQEDTQNNMEDTCNIQNITDDVPPLPPPICIPSSQEVTESTQLNQSDQPSYTFSESGK